VELYPVVREKDKRKGVVMGEAVNAVYLKTAIKATKSGGALLMVAPTGERLEENAPITVDKGVMALLLMSRAVVCLSTGVEEGRFGQVIKVSDQMWDFSALRKEVGQEEAQIQVEGLVAGELGRLRKMEWE
jgi:hypothetical protein